MRFADANIFLRALAIPVTAIDQVRAADCQELFRRVNRGGEEISTSEAVLAEVVFILESPRQYGLAAPDIVGRLKPLMALPGLALPNRRLYLRALDLFAAYPRLGFEEALTVAYIEHSGDELYSYDADFDRVPGITRREPAPSATTT